MSAGFVHARTFDTRWGLVLAFITLRERDDCEVLRFQTWQPITESGELGEVKMDIGLNAGASDAAHDAMSKANRASLAEMTTDQVEKGLRKAGVGDVLDDLLGLSAS